MRVGYDLTPLQLNWAGERRYAQELFEALRARGDVHLEPLVLTTRRPANLLQRVVSQATAEAVFYPLVIGRAARRRGVELMHYPRHLVPREAGLSVPAVVTMHDVFAFTHPELYSAVIRHHQRLVTGGALRRAVRVITGSESSRRGIAEVFGIPLERIAVTPYGVSERFQPRPAEPDWLRQRFGIDGPYVACVGTLEPRKNLPVVLEAFGRLPAELDAHRLVLIGGSGWRTSTFGGALEALGDRVVLTGYVEDDELVRLVSSADCFVHPALFEGFGFPVLEAMGCGTPVVSSDGGSLAEVVGDAGLLVDPTDPGAFAEAIARLLGSPELASTLRERGLARAREHTWAACAAATVRVYEEALAA